MVNQKKLAGYEEFIEYITNLKINTNQKVNIYFTGSKDSAGISWCPDCNVAQPFVDAALAKLNDDSHWIYVDVGDRTYWKNMKNPFRTDKNCRLMVIPTLIRWKGPQRLEGEQINNTELLDLFFYDE